MSELITIFKRHKQVIGKRARLQAKIKAYNAEIEELDEEEKQIRSQYSKNESNLYN